MDENVMLTKADLKKRGWTDSLITLYLCEPDDLKTNMLYKSGPKMKLYKLTRVIDMEKNELFISDFRIAQKRSESARKGALKKKTELIDYIKGMKIVIPQLPEETLIKNACDHYNDLWDSRGRDDKRASPSNDERFLNRIAVNYLRHELTTYENELERMFGKVGAAEGRSLLKEKILYLISEAYLVLWSECMEQLDRLDKEY